MILKLLSYLFEGQGKISWRKMVQFHKAPKKEFEMAVHINFITRIIQGHYNQMVNLMILNEKDEISFSHVFYDDNLKFRKEASHYFALDINGKHYSIFPWHIIAAHIFWDFLFAGGQKYITFCKHCGRFSLSKRLMPDGSPEKIFCSNKCRTANKRV